MVFQGENLESGLWWLDPVTTSFERCSLLEGVAVEEPYCLLSLWCHEMVGADTVIVVVCQPLV